VTTEDRSVPIDDRADRVHDGEDGDPGLADPSERSALSRRLALVEIERLAGGRRPSCPARPEREYAWPG
jgi:hypothetical protein